MSTITKFPKQYSINTVEFDVTFANLRSQATKRKAPNLDVVTAAFPARGPSSGAVTVFPGSLSFSSDSRGGWPPCSRAGLLLPRGPESSSSERGFRNAVDGGARGGRRRGAAREGRRKARYFRYRFSDS